VLTRDAAVSDRAADLALVAVDGGRVDVPVPHVEGVTDCLVAAPTAQLPGTEADQGHGATARPGQGRLLLVVGGHAHCPFTVTAGWISSPWAMFARSPTPLLGPPATHRPRTS